MCAMILAPLALKKLSNRTILKCGQTLDLIGLLLLFFVNSSKLIYLFFALIGMGGFFIDSGSNAYISEKFASRKNTLIPLLHFSFSVGALSCGYLVLPFKSNESWRFGYLCTGVLMLALFISGFLIKSRDNSKNGESAEVKQIETAPVKTILCDRVFMRYCLVIVFYMTSQQICSNWLPLFIEKEFNASNTLVASTTMSFWVGIAILRFLSPFLLKNKNLTALKISSWGLLVSLFSITGLLISDNVYSALVCAAICGLGSGATIPLFIVETTEWYPGNTGFISTFYLMCGTVGRAVFTYLVAVLGEEFGIKPALGIIPILLLASTLMSFSVMNSRKAKTPLDR